MKAGELAASLGVARETLYTWMRRPDVAKYLSPGALGQVGSAHRLFTESDVLVFKTIHHLRHKENITDWQAISAYIESGERYDQFPQNAISADPRTIPLPQAEQSARAAATLAERDNALARVRELENELERMRGEMDKQRERSDTKIEALYREIAELRYQMGKLEADKGRE